MFLVDDPLVPIQREVLSSRWISFEDKAAILSDLARAVLNLREPDGSYFALRVIHGQQKIFF